MKIRALMHTRTVHWRMCIFHLNCQMHYTCNYHLWVFFNSFFPENVCFVRRVSLEKLISISWVIALYINCLFFKFYYKRLATLGFLKMRLKPEVASSLNNWWLALFLFLWTRKWRHVWLIFISLIGPEGTRSADYA